MAHVCVRCKWPNSKCSFQNWRAKVLKDTEPYIFFQGEEYKLFWPEQSEFVRMASKFGAKIVPFGVVGEDDVGEVSLDIYLMLYLHKFLYYCLAYHIT